MTYAHDIGILLGPIDESPPKVISKLEVLAFLMQLLSDIRGVEDGLEVHPVHLQLRKLLQDIRYPLQTVEPLHDPPLEGLLKRRKQHRLGTRDMVVHQSHSVIEALYYPPSFEGSKLKTDVLPPLRHLIEVVLDVELLHRLLGDLDAALDVLHKTHTQSSGKREIFIGLDF